MEPYLAEKVADIVSLYLDPPSAALVQSIDAKTVDAKTQVQASCRSDPADSGATSTSTSLTRRCRPRHQETVWV
ncbi:hypothetical protein ABZS66_58125 [Dactylosporangium sp. NPDC005572]|uniref:hypothetical protein n=1 Tax=Dactylosporangium sp. NPDC005572 TaxID=3156889 RepID=UPI0033B893D7